MDLEKLSIYQIIHGLFLALDNAKSLIEDAELLFAHNRTARTYVISQLANEEIGKAFVLFNLYMSLKDENEIIDYKKIRESFYSHKLKTHEATMADFMIAGSKSLSESQIETEIDNIISEIQKGKGEYDILKNRGLYVSVEDHKFVSPDSSITIEDARSSLTKAKARHERSFFEMSREIDFDLKAYIQDCIPIHNISLPMVCVITNHLGVTR